MGRRGLAKVGVGEEGEGEEGEMGEGEYLSVMLSLGDGGRGRHSRGQLEQYSVSLRLSGEKVVKSKG